MSVSDSGIALAAIYTYPIKSCGALVHTRRALDTFGLEGDRRWMVVDGDGLFMTQREVPALAVIQPALEPGFLRLSAPGMASLRVPLESERQAVWRVQVWRDTCDAADEGSEVAGWLSDYLHTTARLVRMAESFTRPVDARHAPQPAQTTFSDGFPLLVVGEESLAELNRRLVERGKEPVPMSRFRPNLVLSGGAAYAEDAWRTVRLGAVTLDVVKSCARCATTTVDQASGQIPDKAEPLATLNTYRKQDGKVMFGQNAIHRAPGTLTVGDWLDVLA